MAILNTVGKILWHYFLVMFMAILYVTTKDMNFSHIFDSPPMTLLQLQIVQFSLYILIASGVVLALLARILGEKGSASSAFFFGLFALGLIMILLQVHGGSLLNPKWTREGMKNLFLIGGSLLGVVGVLGYAALRFPSPPTDDLLLRLIEERKRSKVSPPEEDSFCPICGPNIRVPLTWKFCPNCGAEFASGVDERGARKLKGGMEGEAEEGEKKLEGEAEKRGGNIVNCPHCGGKMKVTVEKRPVKVRCPHCGSEVLLR